MDLDITQILVAALPSLLGGGGLVMGVINMIRERRRKRYDELERHMEDVDVKLSNDFKRFENIDRRIDNLTDVVEQTCKVMEHGVEGIMIGLENDRIVFQALRDNHINGESVRQEERINEYYSKCMKHSFDIKKHEKSTAGG